MVSEFASTCSNSHEHIKICERTLNRVPSVWHGLVHDSPNAAPRIEDVVAHPPSIADRGRPGISQNPSLCLSWREIEQLTIGARPRLFPIDREST